MSELLLAIRLFWLPLFLLLLAGILGRYSAQPADSLVSAALAPIAGMLAAALGCTAALLALWQGGRLVGAVLGIGELCHRCGMPVRQIRPGRYGPHYRCVACGTNRRID